jgi:BRCT domain type II-containing protein
METIKKQRKPRKPAREDTKRRIAESKEGKTFTPEHCAALSQAHIRRSQLFAGIRQALEEVPVRELPEALKERAEALHRANQK